MGKVDVTDKVVIEWTKRWINESTVNSNRYGEEWVAIGKCVCGAVAEAGEDWVYTLGVYEDMPDECPHCGRKFFAEFGIKVYQVTEGESDG